MSKWLCAKCNSWNQTQASRCSFCSNPRSDAPPQVDSTGDLLTQRLHSIVERLTPIQKQKLYRYFEDNVL